MVEVVAEISGNHGGVQSKMLAMIWEAADCGCDYAKFQFYRPEDMPDADEGDNRAMYERLMVPDHWLPLMFQCAKANSIGLFASVFSVRAAKEILKYDVPYVKLASPESTWLPLQTYIDIIEVAGATDVIISTGYKDLTLMAGLDGHLMFCPPGHPPDIQKSDLRNFVRGPFWGFSDHTAGIRWPLHFIGRGAKMIEKHFRLEGDNDCVDAAFSADPLTMKLLCRVAHNR